MIPSYRPGDSTLARSGNPWLWRWIRSGERQHLMMWMMVTIPHSRVCE